MSKQDSFVATLPKLKAKLFVDSLLQVLFYSKDGNVDRMAKVVCGSPSIVACPKTLAKWFAVLDHVNPKYKISQSEAKALTMVVEQSVSEQKSSHMVISDKDSLQHKVNLAPDVAASQQVDSIVSDAHRLELKMNE